MLRASSGHTEEQRLAALSTFDLDGIAQSGLLRELLALAASVCAQSTAVLNIIERDAQRCLLACGGEPLQRASRGDSFCAHVVDAAEAMVVPDAALDERFRDSRFVTGAPRIRFYAGAPITVPEGLTLGALCVLGPQPAHVDERQREQLGRLAHLVAGVFLLHRRQDVEARTAAQALRVAQERSAAEQARVLKALKLQQAALAAASDGILICDARAPDLPLVYANAAFEAMTGYAVAEALGRNCRFLQGEDREQPGLAEIRAALHEGRTGMATVRNYRKDGSLFWNSLRIAPVRDDSGSVTHFVGSQNDVSERMRIEQDLAYRAYHDPVTGLPNRQLLEERLGHAVAKARRGGALIGVGFIDLDNFKVINDSIGHAAGDTVLRTIAGRLKDSVREGDTVARLGSDEFVLLIEALESEQLLREVAERILAAIATPIELDGKEYVAGASVGLALFPRDGGTGTELVKHADFAMYKAKQDGRGVIRSYRAEYAALDADRFGLERSLRQALAKREFALEYQPKCDARTGRVSGVEALLRWHHPERGRVPPLQFITLAEQVGVIVPLGEWVLEEACARNAGLRRRGLPQFRVAVNVSGIQFKQPDFVDRLCGVLERTGLPPSGLALEITESVTMSDPEHFTKVLGEVKALGVSIALDDFGTGYSSLSYLKRFPIDQVKIDRSFVRDITTDSTDAAICSAIISMAHHLGMGVVAEGVETDQQADFLRARHCDELQGYLLGQPMSGALLEQWLAQHDRASAGP